MTTCTPSFSFSPVGYGVEQVSEDLFRLV
jgi:hypothetical protein